MIAPCLLERLSRINSRRPVARLVLVLAFLAGPALGGPPSGSSAGPVPLLDQIAAEPNAVGVYAVRVSDGKVLARMNESASLNPASTMKLVTTYAGLALLGPGYRWRTEIHLRGTLRGDTLAGDLLIRGGGDPKLVVEDMVELVARMRAAGLRSITGDLLVDDSLFAPGAVVAEPIDGDVAQPYNVGPSAALMNFKSTRFVIDPHHRSARITLDPPLADVRVFNQVRVIGGRCRFGPESLSIRDESNEKRAAVRVVGNYSRTCGEQGAYAAVLTHRQFIHGFFKAAWTAAGGEFRGKTRYARGLATGQPWLVWESPRTLAEVAHDINKNSNNVMTRQLLLQIAADARQAPATVDAARDTVRGFLALRGLVFPELVIENGSGLSRNERISAQNLARLLVDAARSPVGELLRESLPVVGVDGTMRRRLRDHPIAGNAWIKTGSLHDVRSIAGYVDAHSGQRYAVAMIGNGPRADLMRLDQDALLRWIFENG